MIEELEKALTCFRTAVRMDPRHYNAWYGIGLTYYKQERFQLTEIYYRKALGLNPYNPILMCHVAVVSRVFHAHYTLGFLKFGFSLPWVFSSDCFLVLELCFVRQNLKIVN